MPSAVDICNLALGHLGDSANVASIDPPEGSVQAEHCARFYPMALASLPELHSWNFATRRVQLSPIASDWSEWDHAYEWPNNALRVLAINPPGATNDYSAGGIYTQKPFAVEINEDGDKVIYTDQEQATAKVTFLVTETARFSPLFTMALSWHLASMLAGPVLKGEAGAAEGKRCIQMMTSYLSNARTSDANQRRVEIEHNVPWITGR